MPAPHIFVSQMSALFRAAFPKNVIGIEKFPPVPVANRELLEVIPTTVVVPVVTLPLNIERAIGFGVGVTVLLPMTILGAAAEGKTVVDGVLVVDSAVVAIGTDC